MSLLNRSLQRLLVLGLGVFTVWLIVFVVFEDADHRLPWVLALGLTYGIAAYVILPRAVRLGLRILHRGRVPSFTTTGDGLPGDPVNVALVGTLQQLRAAFANARMVGGRSTGPGQFMGHGSRIRLKLALPNRAVQHALSFRPRPRHRLSEGNRQQPPQAASVRFWALSLVRAEDTWGAASFWLNTERPPNDERVLWVGAGTRDTGLSFTRLTFQITHATDSDTNVERNFIIDAVGEGSNHRCGESVSSRPTPSHGTRQSLHHRWEE